MIIVIRVKEVGTLDALGWVETIDSRRLISQYDLRDDLTPRQYGQALIDFRNLSHKVKHVLIDAFESPYE